MEVFSYHEGLKKWVEIGNSGMFRPEMLEPIEVHRKKITTLITLKPNFFQFPMGLPKNVNAIAWGLSLERPVMIKYGYNNIRDLCGNKIDLNTVYSNPLCRMDFIK